MKRVRDNYAVMYEVIGLTNNWRGQHAAHITVYFGTSKEEAANY